MQVEWSKERFDEVQNIVGAFLKQAGFLLKNVTWVPCSGLTGENLIARKDPKLAAWYSGPTLVQAIGTDLLLVHASRPASGLARSFS
jgi:elongation factor 1 alpha-like protein